MPQVSFYILTASAERAHFELACRLVEKAYKQGHHCHILTDSEAQGKIMDDLLWTFNEGSFIPHQLQTTTDNPVAPQSLISSHPQVFPCDEQAILVNLVADFPSHFAHYFRVLELVANNPEAKQRGRERYRQYQQHGITPSTHTL